MTRVSWVLKGPGCIELVIAALFPHVTEQVISQGIEFIDALLMLKSSRSIKKRFVALSIVILLCFSYNVT